MRDDAAQKTLTLRLLASEFPDHLFCAVQKGRAFVVGLRSLFRGR